MKLAAVLALASAAVVAAQGSSSVPVPSKVLKRAEPITDEHGYKPTDKGKKRSEISVYVCNDANYNGYCQNFALGPQDCLLLGDDFNNKIGSVQPAFGSFCTFYTDASSDAGCNTGGDVFQVGYPGYTDLKQVPVNGPQGIKNFNNKISSISCDSQ
ncbi:hypothetical protein J1614_001553 [Plenodomus biglobosus]|nr:hypothetical protein J1614_001553 [Plenodomus biglobosus]